MIAMKFSLWATATLTALGLFIPSQAHSFERITLIEQKASTALLLSHRYRRGSHSHRKRSYRRGYIRYKNPHYRRGHHRFRRSDFHRGRSFQIYSPHHQNFRRFSPHRSRRKSSFGIFIGF